MRISFIVLSVFLCACGGGSSGLESLVDADATSEVSDSVSFRFVDLDSAPADILEDPGAGNTRPSLQLPPGDEEVEILAEDGTRIFGKYLTPGGLSPYPALLLIHQYGESHVQWMPWAGGEIASTQVLSDTSSSPDVNQLEDSSQEPPVQDAGSDTSVFAEISESDSGVGDEDSEELDSSPLPSEQDDVETLISRGFAVLSIDLRGHGASDEYPQGLALLVDPQGAPQDVRAALSWMKTQQAIDPDRIAIMGASMGANLSYLAMAERLAVAGVAISAREQSIESLMGLSSLSDVDFASVMCVAGELDSSGAQKKTCNALMSLTEQPNPVSIVEGSADHGFGLLANHPDIWTEILSFLEDATAP